MVIKKSYRFIYFHLIGWNWGGKLWFKMSFQLAWNGYQVKCLSHWRRKLHLISMLQRINSHSCSEQTQLAICKWNCWQFTMLKTSKGLTVEQRTSTYSLKSQLESTGNWIIVLRISSLPLVQYLGMQTYCVSRFFLIILQDIPLCLHKLSENIQVLFLSPNTSLIQSRFYVDTVLCL